ncbi:hypothetical protein HX109_10815 [Galbibacter sp. BG1]|nr:hypothetical protein HX109_10815 [Galbibacter sp. BG1]
MESELDFVGKVQQRRTMHRKGSGTWVVTVDSFAYDHMGRLEDHFQCIGEGSGFDGCSDNADGESFTLSEAPVESWGKTAIEHITLTDGFHFVATSGRTFHGSIAQQGELIAHNDYDHLGQLKEKLVGNTKSEPLQTVKYEYNIRGWLKKINDPSNLGNSLFGFGIRYNDPIGGTALYNGNISQTQWGTKSTNSTGNPVSSRYTYSYDALNRITAAMDNTPNQNYSVSGIAYDQNGNITKLHRKGHINEAATAFGSMDNLTYAYDSGNRLSSVTDAVNTPALMKGEFKDGNKSGHDYDYDENGNMTEDRNKGITGIAYNHLNLPDKVSFGSGEITYIYDATGMKLRKEVSESGSVTSTTDYSGSYIYENSELQFFSHTEGYVDAEGTGYRYVYQYKDHLGNVRLSYQDADGNGSIATNEIVEESNYYPFGLEHKGYNNVVNGVENNYFNFNGKELDESLGLNVIEMDFRQYDPALGRFNVVDAMAEERNWLSPYNFVQNNPIMRVDPTGLLDDYGLDQDGNIELIKETDDKTDTLYSVTRGEDGELVKDDNGEVVRNDTNGDGEVADGDSVTVNKGILNKKKTNTVEASNGKEYTFDQFNITGDSQAQSLFEFVGANSNVEWSLTGVGSKNGAQGSNILTTSHIENSEIGGGYLFAYGYSIRFSNHSHPYSNNASRADRNFAKTVNAKFPNARTRILHKGSYTLYDEKGSIKPIQIKPAPIAPLKPFKN